MKASEGLIRVLVDGDKFKDLVKKHNVSGYPTIVFLDPSGKQVEELNGREADAVKKQFAAVIDKYGRAPKWMDDADRALEAGKSDSKPVALVFADDKPKSQAFLKVFGDEAFGDTLAKVAWAKVEFKKDSDECKKWKVTEAPAMLLIDATGDEPQVVEKVTGGKAKELKKKLDDLARKLEKK